MDLQDKISLGAAMFATPAIDRGATTMLAEVASDASGGEVTVNLPDEEGTVQQVTVPCNGDIREGDMATLLVEDGRITAISAGGEGERSKAETEAAQGAADAAQSTADGAQADATQAKTDAADAKETAAGAETAAGEAKDAADTAKSAADAAKDAADTAQSAADAASSAATDASTKADAAQSAADAAQADATQAKTDAASAATAAASAQTLAEEAKATATATGQHFFTDDAGVHVTTDEGEAAGTHNLLANSKGVFIRKGNSNLAGMTASGFSIYEDGSTSASFTNNAVSLAGGSCYIQEIHSPAWWTEGSYTNLHIGVTNQVGYERQTLSLGVQGGSGESTVFAASGYWDSSNGYPNITIGDFQECGDLVLNGQQVSIIADPTAEAAKGEGDLILAGQSVVFGAKNKYPMTYIVEDDAGINLRYNTPEGVTKNAALAAYPVGSIYMSVNSTSPADLFGGTWEEIAGGRVLMGQNTTYKAGSTGGAATHTHTGPSHTHTGPSHTHSYGFAYVCHYGAMLAYNTDGSFRILNNGTWENTPTRSSSASVGNNAPVMAATGRTTASVARVAARANTSSAGTGTTGASGTGNTGSASSLMPYLSVYMWKRTA